MSSDNLLRNSGHSLAAEHDNGLAGLIFRSRADLIAGQIKADAIWLIGRRKMQGPPIDYDFSAAHTENPPKSITAARTCPPWSTRTSTIRPRFSPVPLRTSLPSAP